MDVGIRIPLRWPILLATCLPLVMTARVLGDPIYTAIDLGTGTPTYGVAPDGEGTITGSNGQTYIFKAATNALPARWSGTTQGVPTVEPAPVWSGDTYGNPAYAHSTSTLSFMNSQGLAAGLNEYGVAGHLGNEEAFITQLQPNGTWGPPTALWSGVQDFDWGRYFNTGIMGVSANGQVLGYGVEDGYSQGPNTLYLYDTKTRTLTDLTSLVNSMKWTNQSNLPNGQIPNWLLSNVLSQIDDQGRILVQATEGYSGTPHELLLVPQGESLDQVAAPEPATWAVFATLIGGWLAHRRFRDRAGRRP